MVRTAIEVLYRHDPERLLARNKLLFSEPLLRARFLGLARDGVEQLAGPFAALRGLAPDDLVLPVTVTALIEAIGGTFAGVQNAWNKNPSQIERDA